MKESMQHNFQGRLQNFSNPVDPFLSVYEAITNSIQSIDKRGIKDGCINIKIFRQQSPLVEGNVFPITKIIIEDNGIGFNDENMKSFKTLDSMYKADIGGKGIGRLNWLKSFDNIDIESVYIHDSQRKKISFNFSVAREIDDINIIATEDEIATSITLHGLKKQYTEASAIPTMRIAERIIENFTPQFVIGLSTNVYVIDETTTYHLNDLFRSSKFIHSDTSQMKIDDDIYEIRHVFVRSSANDTHQIFVCAHNRVVNSYKIKSIEDLPSSFDVGNHKAIYQCFVSGERLDNDVNPERNGFNSISTDELKTDDIFGSGAIYKKINEAVAIYLDKYLAPIKTAKMDVIRDFIRDKAPEYGYLYKKSRPDLETIPVKSTKSADSIALELYKIKQKIDYQNMIEIKEVVQSDSIDSDKIQKIMEKVTDSAKSELVTYVARRKWIIELLSRKIGTLDFEKYYDEKELHKLFFPMRAEDTSIDYDQHNLWLIDERLAYSYKFFSDMKLRKVLTNSDSDSRPDGLFFDEVAFTDSMNGKANNVIICEFKKPNRDDYTMEDNPFNQIFKYQDELLGNTAHGKDGAVVVIDGNTKFVGYIIADMTKKLEALFKNFSVRPSSDGLTYFTYFEQRNLFIEVIPYSAIVENSKKRNKIFFDKLGI